MYNDINRIHTRDASLTAVLVPTTRAEVSALVKLFMIWGGYAQLAAGRKSGPPSCRLIVTLDCDHDSDLESKIISCFDQFCLSAVFKSMNVAFCNIPPDENIYIRNGQEQPALVPKLGLKSGPNTQFFRSLLDYCDGEDVVLLNEVDCFPVSIDWLARISRLVQGSEPFWVLGSPYRGYGRLGPDIVAHVNGNALYGVGTDGFKDVLMKYWYEGLVTAISAKPNLAYDVFLDYSHHEILNPSTWRGAPLEKFRFYSALLCKVRHTDLIHNLAGTDELTGRVQINLADYIVAYPTVTLVHGKFLYDQVLQALIAELKANDLGNWLVDRTGLLDSKGEAPGGFIESLIFDSDANITPAYV